VCGRAGDGWRTYDAGKERASQQGWAHRRWLRDRVVSAKASLPAAAKRFLLMQLALSPVEAGEAGLHIYQGRNLDRELDDFSPTELAAQHKLLLAGQQCFTRFDSRKLSAEDAVDLAMLRRTISDSLYRDTEVQDEHYRPDHYVELLGSALFFR
jgi:uncharacterized protein (DUF885 family)